MCDAKTRLGGERFIPSEASSGRPSDSKHVGEARAIARKVGETRARARKCCQIVLVIVLVVVFLGVCGCNYVFIPLAGNEMVHPAHHTVHACQLRVCSNEGFS